MLELNGERLVDFPPEELVTLDAGGVSGCGEPEGHETTAWPVCPCRAALGIMLIGLGIDGVCHPPHCANACAWTVLSVAIDQLLLTTKW